ncbi:MAG: sugar transferase [Akkermansia sp.]|nr:sugar transferase [Akkermansia sp.]MBR5876542.1 sugar transferase [Akkermansia sp.]
MTRSRKLVKLVLPIIDLMSALTCAYISPWVANAVAPYVGWHTEENFNAFTSSPFMAGAAVAVVPILLRMVGFYHRNNLQRVSTALRQLFTFIVYYLCMMGIYLLVVSDAISTYMNHLILVCIILIPLVIFLRYFVLRFLQMNTPVGRRYLRSVLIAGKPEDIETHWQTLPDFWKRSLTVVGKVTPETSQEQVQQMIEENHVDRLILMGGMAAYHDNEETITRCELQGIDIYVHLKDGHPVSMRADVSDIGDHRVLILTSTPVYSWARLFKSVFDRVMAAVGIILSSPFWLIAAIGIKLSDPKGPIFFKQQRSGLYGKPFGMWKFRSMYVDAEERLAEIKEKYGNEMDGPIFKLTNDPRIFKFGHFIRKFSIDELPQLLNILMGDMSIVGPRPLPVYETKEFPEYSQRRRLSVKPGLTCYWQVEGRSNTESFDFMVNKDLKYIDNWSLWIDFKLILLTIPAVLFGKGAK